MKDTALIVLSSPADRRHRGTSHHDRAGGDQLGGPYGLARSGDQLAGLSRLSLDTMDSHRCSRSPSWSPINFPLRQAARCRCSSARGLPRALSPALRLAFRGEQWLAAFLRGLSAQLSARSEVAPPRARLAAAFGSDRPAALIEDAVAIGGALLIVMTVR